jgi:hypothetical protein
LVGCTSRDPPPPHKCVPSHGNLLFTAPPSQVQLESGLLIILHDLRPTPPPMCATHACMPRSVGASKLEPTPHRTLMAGRHKPAAMQARRSHVVELLGLRVCGAGEAHGVPAPWHAAHILYIGTGVGASKRQPNPSQPSQSVAQAHHGAERVRRRRRAALHVHGLHPESIPALRCLPRHQPGVGGDGTPPSPDTDPGISPPMQEGASLTLEAGQKMFSTGVAVASRAWALRSTSRSARTHGHGHGHGAPAPQEGQHSNGRPGGQAR